LHSLAVSLRVDGAVDKQSLDNKHVMAKCITTNGDEKTVYLGFSESEERGSKALYRALQTAAAMCGVPWNTLFSLTSSIVTDGASENTGTHHSLWKHLSDEREGSEVRDLPLLKILCGVHRSQLAFKDMVVNISEVSHIISDCKGLVNYYNGSALRMKGIRNAALECRADIMAFPSVKDIRFTEYSYSMLLAVLTNYKSTMKHLESVMDAEGKGLFEKWLDQDTVHAASVLCDALYVYKRFQKLIQGDQITIFDLQQT